MRFTGEDYNRYVEDVLERMERAGWVKSYDFIKVKGWHINWTPAGANIALDLKIWSEKLALAETEEHVAILDELAHGRMLNPNSDSAALDDALSPLIEAGYAGSVFIHKDVGTRIQWTPAGLAFLEAFATIVDQLGIHRDGGRLRVMLMIATGWAPTPGSLVGDA